MAGGWRSHAVEFLLSILRTSEEAYRDGNDSIRARETAEHCLGLIGLLSAQRGKLISLLLHLLAKIPKIQIDPTHKAVCHAVAMLHADELEENAWRTIPILETQWELHMAGFSEDPPILREKGLPVPAGSPPPSVFLLPALLTC